MKTIAAVALALAGSAAVGVPRFANVSLGWR